MKPNSFLPIVVAALFLTASYSRADSTLPQLPTLSQPLSLNDAVQIAKQNNLTISGSVAVRSETEAQKRKADAALLPSSSATTYGTLGDSNNIVTSSPDVGPQNVLSIAPHGFIDQNLTVMAPVFTGGKLSGLIRSAKSDDDAAALEVAQSNITVEEETADLYIDTQLSASLVQAAQDRLTAEDEQVRVTAKEVETGAAAPVDLLREQAEDADALTGLVSAQNDEALDLVQLKNVLGVSQNSVLTLSESLDSVIVTAAIPSSVDEAVSDAEANSPKLEAALKQVESGRERLQSLSGSYAPQVFVLGMADASSSAGGAGRVGYTVGLTASLPIYDAGARKDDIDSAKSNVQQSTYAAEQVRQMVDVDVETDWLKLQAASRQIKSTELGLAAAKQAYTLEMLKYSAGKSTDSERLDFLKAQSDASSALSTAVADEAKAQIDIFAAMGSFPALK